MRHLKAPLLLVLSLKLASLPAFAQQTPALAPEASAPEAGNVSPETAGRSTVPRALGRTINVRRGAVPVPAAGPQRPPDQSLNINGIPTLGLMTGGLNGTFVQIGSDVSAVASSDALRVVPMMGKGSLQNLADLLNLRGVDLALVAADSIRFAETRNLHPGIRTRISYIAKLYDQEIHTLAGADVHSVDDLAGKTVNVDVVGSGTSVTAPAVFEAMHLSVNLAYDIPSVALEKLKRGEIAALMYVNGKPSRLFATIPANSGLHLVALPTSELFLDTYIPATFTHADYPSLISDGETVETLAVPVLLTAYNWPPGTPRYQNLAAFTNLFFSRLPELLKPPYHEKWHDVSLRATVPGWTRAPYAQRWLDQSPTNSAAGPPAPVATGFEREAFTEWATGIGLPKLTATQTTELYRLWKLRRNQAQQ